MPYDFEALVGHLHVVGGRSINAAPPGLLVEVAPKKAARGRELDTFFTLVLPSDEHAAPARFYEQMAQLGAERYFSSTGSVTAGLRTVFISLNEDLTEHNQSGKKRYEASLLVAVLHGNELIVGRVGSGVALVWREGETQPFPAEFGNDEALFGPPLGVHPVPDIKLARYAVQQGTRLLVADPRLADIEMEQIRAAVSSADLSAVLAAFKEQTPTSLMLLAVEFIPPDVPSPIPAREAETTAKTSTQEAAQVVETAPIPEKPSKPHRLETASVTARAQAQKRVGGLALILARGLDGMNRLLERFIPLPVEGGGRPGLRASTMTGAAVLFPVIIVLIVIVMWLSQTDVSAFEMCVQEAQKTAEVAHAIASSDREGTLAAWSAVMTVVKRCSEMRTGDPTLQALTREAQSIIDVLFRINRRETTLLATFSNAALKQIVLQGLDLYVLDGQNQWVYRVALTSDGRQIIPDSKQPVAAMRLGAAVGEFRIGSIFDIAWAEASTQIIALDSDGVLIGCSPRFLQSCDAQRLLGAEKWQTPLAVTLWQDKLYILDPGANQIWRYEPSGGDYANAPSEYFVGQVRPDLRNAVDFGIDDKGNIYILSALGEITRWRSGEQTPFAFVDFPETLTAADALFLNNDPIGQGLFVVSRATRTIYETSLAGTFSASYRAFNEDDFALLSGVVTDASQGVIYVLSGNAVFALERQQ